MGGYLSTLSKLIWAKKEIRILILGLVRQPRARRKGFTMLIMNAGQCWQDYITIQTEGKHSEALRSGSPKENLEGNVLTKTTDWRSSHNDTNNRLQRRISNIQES